MAVLQMSFYNLFAFQDVRYFNSIDENRDQFLDRREASRFLKERKNISMPNMSWFSKMDINNDGRISPNEFDEDLNADILQSFQN